jgi:hypothetical protein
MMARFTPWLASTLLATLLLSSPLAAQAGQTWTFDETTVGQNVSWMSPTSVNPSAAIFNTSLMLTTLEVGIEFLGIPFGNISVIDQVPPELQGSIGEVPGPAPITLVAESVVYPPAPEPIAVGADISIGMDANGFGVFSATNVVLGTISVDLGFPFGVVDVTIVSLHVAGNLTMHPTWYDLGNALAGTGATPATVVSGSLVGSSSGSIGVATDLAFGTAHLVIGLSQINAAFKGGVLVPAADVLILGLPLDAAGDIAVPFVWPAGVPSRASIYLQFWMPDAGAIVGFAASNGVRGETP